MNAPGLLEPFFDTLNKASSLRWRGRVLQVIGNLVESDGPCCSVGDSCEILSVSGKNYLGEVIGFRGSKTLSMSVDSPQGIRLGDRILSRGMRPSIRVGEDLLGRVIDATGAPLDSKDDYRAERTVWVDGAAPQPLDRVPIREPLGCGVRALDGFVTCGRGQRLGIFGGSGVGKSTLLGMMLRGTSAMLSRSRPLPLPPFAVLWPALELGA